MISRRSTLGALAAWAAASLTPRRAFASRPLRDEIEAELTGGAPVGDDRVTLTIPAIAENGLSVYTTVEVDSPMTEADHVRAIHILAEKNPIARLATFHLGPRSGVARIATNIRLADSQQVTALAELSDGSYWRDRRDVLVTLAACIDGG